MTSLPTNSKGDTLLQRNPMVLPVCLLLLNTTFLVGLCFAVRFWISDDSQKLMMMVAIIAFFVLSTGGLILHCLSLLRDSVVSVETASAALLSVLPAVDQGSISSITSIANACANEIENLRYASQLIADYSSDLLFSITEDLKIIELNASAQRALSAQKVTLIGTSFLSIVSAADQHNTKTYFEKVSKESSHGESPASLECQLQLGEGKLIDVRWTIEWSRSMKAFYCIGEDITVEKEIQRLRAEITAMVSHDLRAPVSSLSFFIDNLLTGDYGVLNEKGRVQVARSRSNVGQLLRLTDQLLDAEKLESGEMRLDVKIVPVSGILESAVQLLQDLAEQKNLKIKFPESETLVHADFDRSVQILSNLLSNAIKFSPNDNHIEISENLHAGQVIIAVRDHGPGIAVERRDELFKRFKSWDGGDKIVQSSGLGLYLAKKLAELQGGNLSFDTPSESTGSVFLFTMKQASEDELPGYLD